jgi:hypothetical protein
MSTFAFVVTASGLYHRLMAANLILSSKPFGNYTWYAILDKPLGIGERFIQMPEGEKNIWRSQENPRKFYLKFASLEKALKVSSEQYLIFLDCDCVFHGPPNIAKLTEPGRRSFALLEGDLLRPGVTRYWWWPNEDTGRAPQAGSLIVLGDAGDALGDSIYEARLFVRGSVKSLGADCIEKSLSDTHKQTLRKLLDEAGVGGEVDVSEFKRYGSARKLYHFHMDNLEAY